MQSVTLCYCPKIKRIKTQILFENANSGFIITITVRCAMYFLRAANINTVYSIIHFCVFIKSSVLYLIKILSSHIYNGNSTWCKGCFDFDLVFSKVPVAFKLNFDSYMMLLTSHLRYLFTSTLQLFLISHVIRQEKYCNVTCCTVYEV